MRAGKGRLIKANGSVKVGNWNMNKLYGQGTITTIDGTQYYGNFFDGKLDGRGSISSAKFHYLGTF